MDDRFSYARQVADRWLTEYLLAALVTLLVGVLLGALGAFVVSEEEFMRFFLQNGGLPEEITFVGLLINNVVAITVMLLGAISLGTFTAAVLLLNGGLIGMVLHYALRDISVLDAFLLIAPHGVIEIPAILIAAAIGYRFGHRPIQYVRGEVETVATRRDLREALLLYLLAVGMLVVAAFIEAEITAQFAESMATNATA